MRENSNIRSKLPCILKGTALFFLKKYRGTHVSIDLTNIEMFFMSFII